MELRRAQFMGSWYPASAAQCEKQIQDFLKDVDDRRDAGVKGTGGIVPHAGWAYSGAVAARVIAALKGGDSPDIIAVFGMHLAPQHPNFIMKAGAWETPFGEIEIAEDVAGRLADGFSFEIETSERHVQDNTIELQLPFIKYFFPEARIIPMGVPPVVRSLAIGEAFADIAAHLGLNAKVLGSTDLTHYGANYGFSPKGPASKAIKWVKEENDKKLVDAILEMNPVKVIDESQANSNACCGGAAATAVAAAKRLGADKAQLLEYTTSYDVSPSDSFVGYAGVVF